MSAVAAGCAASPARCCLESNHAIPTGCTRLLPCRGTLDVLVHRSAGSGHRLEPAKLLPIVRRWAHSCSVAGSWFLLGSGYQLKPAKLLALRAQVVVSRPACFPVGIMPVQHSLQQAPCANPACACTCPSPHAALRAAWCTCTAGGQPSSIAT